ncbi:MAG: extracellular solute-binding protein [Xanthobacteraceae bacterium]|nr:MAG: extracellular solute-binding protein [Xanthobacteraceae bacterium]
MSMPPSHEGVVFAIPCAHLFRKQVMLKERPFWLPLQIALVCLLMITALWAALTFESNRWERTAIEQSRRDVTNLATGFREHIRRMIGAIDQLMITIIEENKEANANRIPKWIDESPLLKDMSLQVSITGPDGIMLASSLGLSGRIDLSDRPHFRYHLDPNAPQPYISVPVLGRLSGKWSIQVTRRITRSDGSFGGILVVSVDPHYFSKFFESIDLGHDGVIVLAGLDGIVRARRSADNQAIGQDLSGAPLLKHVQSAESGSYIAVSKVDDIERLYAFSRVPDYPLAVSVGTSTAEIYAAARRDRLGGVIVGVVVTISVIGLGLLLIREVDRRRRQADNSIREQKDHLDAAVNNIRVGMTLWDQGERLIFCNARFIEMYGLPPDQIKPGISFADVLLLRQRAGSFSENAPEHAHKLRSVMLVGQQQSYVLETKDGRTIQITSNPIPGRGWVTIHEDITERRKADDKIAHLALHDILTGLPNRAAFNDALARTMAKARTRGEVFSLLCIDIDRFKEVNDLFGHAIGDELLRQAADRFRAAVAPNFVSRLGGDEFVVIATEATEPDVALRLAKQLTSAFAAEFEINGFRLPVHLSIGISMYPTDAEDPVALLVNADTALYRAKADGRDTTRFFEPEMDRQLRDRWELKRELANALGTDDLVLHYQPIAKTGSDIVGFEALARWSHPSRGAIPPDTFIPIAEESGLILQFGEWALNNAEIALEPMIGFDQLAKVSAARSNPPLDVMMLDPGPSLTAAAQDLIVPFPAEKSKHFADIHPAARSELGVSPCFQVIGLAYNPERIKTPPTSWADMWKPEYKGRVGITSMNSTLGTAFMVEVARMRGGSEANIDEAFKALAELKPNIGAVAANPSQAAALFQQGQIDIAPAIFNEIQLLKARDVAVDIVLPKERGVGYTSTMHIVKNSPHAELAFKYIEACMSPEVQSKLVSAPYMVVPTNSKVKMTGEVAKLLGNSPEELSKKLVVQDWKVINQNRTAWIDRFNRDIKA